MPRIDLVSQESIPADVRATLKRRVKARGQGRISEIFRLLARKPPLAAAFAEQNMKLYEALPIDATQREAMIIRIANVFDAPYVRDAHIDIGRRAGLCEKQTLALASEAYRAPGVFPSDTVCLIDYATEVVTAPGDVSAARCDNLIDEYGETGFMVITMLCAQYASASLFTTVLQLQFSP